MAARFSNRNQELDYQNNVTPAGKAGFEAARAANPNLTYTQWKSGNVHKPWLYTVGGGNPAPAAAPAAVPAVPPHLSPDEQAQWNRDHFGIAGERIQNEEDWQRALANDPLVKAQIDLQYRKGVRSTGETMAARGVQFSGIADSALWDIGRTKELAEIEHTNAMDSAKRRHDAVSGNLNQQDDALELWRIDASRANASPGTPGAPTAAPRPPAPAAPAPAPAQPAQPGGPPPSPNHWWTGTRWVPIGKAVPASHGSFASGSPPSPNHAWNGTKWVKVR